VRVTTVGIDLDRAVEPVEDFSGIFAFTPRPIMEHLPMMVKAGDRHGMAQTIGVVESAWIPNIFPGTLITSKSKSELSKWPTAAARSHVPNAHDDS
jgi:hypothetical protein